jgi:hypothetical protein
MSIVIFFSHNPIFTGAAWANAMPEDLANAAINTNERLNSPQHLSDAAEQSGKHRLQYAANRSNDDRRRGRFTI